MVGVLILFLKFLIHISHFVKSVLIRSFSGPYFLAFVPNTGKYSAYLSVFNPNVGKGGPQILLIQALFEQWQDNIKRKKKFKYLDIRYWIFKHCLIWPHISSNTFFYVLRFEWMKFSKKWSFSLRICSENVTQSAVSCGFGHIYWRNP